MFTAVSFVVLKFCVFLFISYRSVTLLFSLTSFCLPIVCVEGYCCTWSHSMAHTYSVGLRWTRDLPVAETSPWQHTTLTRARYQCLRPDSNPQSQQASGLRQPGYRFRLNYSYCIKIYSKYLHTLSARYYVLKLCTSLAIRGFLCVNHIGALSLVCT